MQQNRIFCRKECARCPVADNHRQFFQVFYHGFGKWCFWVTSWNVVGLLKVFKCMVNSEQFPNISSQKRFPFNWKNPCGYMMAVVVQSLWVSVVFTIIGCILLLSFGCFVFSLTAAKTLKSDLHSIDKMARKKNSRCGMYKKLCKFLEIHANLKQLSRLSVC